MSQYPDITGCAGVAGVSAGIARGNQKEAISQRRTYWPGAGQQRAELMPGPVAQPKLGQARLEPLLLFRLGELASSATGYDVSRQYGLAKRRAQLGEVDGVVLKQRAHERKQRPAEKKYVS
jgi:hypothetical protein